MGMTKELGGVYPLENTGPGRVWYKQIFRIKCVELLVSIGLWSLFPKETQQPHRMKDVCSWKYGFEVATSGFN